MSDATPTPGANEHVATPATSSRTASLNRYRVLLDENTKAHSVSTPYRDRVYYRPKSIEESIKERQGQLENDALAQDIQLKKYTLLALFIFLAAETAIVFIMAFLQGFGLGHFRLEEWSFRLIVAATISQITAMLFVAVRHLFPTKA